MRGRWLSRRALGLHLALIIVVPGCLVAAWWQANVAFSGNTLSYLYAVEWPLFAGIGVVMWWQLIHDIGPEQLTAGRRHRRGGKPSELDLKGETSSSVGPGETAPVPAPAPQRRSVRVVDEESEEMAAYNDYLATLADRSSRSRGVK